MLKNYQPSTQALEDACIALDAMNEGGKCVTATDYLCRAFGHLLYDFLQAELKHRDEQQKREDLAKPGPHRGR